MNSSPSASGSSQHDDSGGDAAILAAAAAEKIPVRPALKDLNAIEVSMISLFFFNFFALHILTTTRTEVIFFTSLHMWELERISVRVF